LLTPLYILTGVGISQMSDGILQVAKLRGHLSGLLGAGRIATELWIRAVLSGNGVHVSIKKSSLVKDLLTS